MCVGACAPVPMACPNGHNASVAGGEVSMDHVRARAAGVKLSATHGLPAGAEQFVVSTKRAVHLMIRRGNLPGQQIGGKFYISIEDFHRKVPSAKRL